MNNVTHASYVSSYYVRAVALHPAAGTATGYSLTAKSLSERDDNKLFIALPGLLGLQATRRTEVGFVDAAYGRNLHWRGE